MLRASSVMRSRNSSLPATPMQISASLLLVLPNSYRKLCKCLCHEVKHVLYDDSMSIDERQAAIAAFHADVPFLIMQTGSSGVGLNLQCATTVILLESDFNATGDIETLDLVARHSLQDVKFIRLVTCSMVRGTFTRKKHQKAVGQIEYVVPNPESCFKIRFSWSSATSRSLPIL